MAVGQRVVRFFELTGSLCEQYQVRPLAFPSLAILGRVEGKSTAGKFFQTVLFGEGQPVLRRDRACGCCPTSTTDLGRQRRRLDPSPRWFLILVGPPRA